MLGQLLLFFKHQEIIIYNFLYLLNDFYSPLYPVSCVVLLHSDVLIFLNNCTSSNENPVQAIYLETLYNMFYQFLLNFLDFGSFFSFFICIFVILCPTVDRPLIKIKRSILCGDFRYISIAALQNTLKGLYITSSGCTLPEMWGCNVRI